MTPSDWRTVTYYEIFLFNKRFTETLYKSPKLEDDTVGEGCHETLVNEKEKQNYF